MVAADQGDILIRTEGYYNENDNKILWLIIMFDLGGGGWLI
jgi:hypothetical protein